MATYFSPMQELGATICDSYPYVTKDAQLWLSLLTAAYSHDRDLFARLNYLRGVGTELVENPGGVVKYRIIPIIDTDKGWSSEEEWNEEKRCLNKHSKLLVRLLNEL